MTIIVTSSKQEKVFDEKDVVNIGTIQNCDFKLDLDFDVLITLEYDSRENKHILMNTFHSERVLFKGKPFGKIEIGNICKIMFAGSEEFISIKILETSAVKKAPSAIQQVAMSEEEMQKLYANDPNAAMKIQLEKQKADIERVRVGIIKEVAFQIQEFKNKIASNSRTSIFLHVAMAFSALLCAFGLANYITGLSIKESANYLHLPTNLKAWFLCAVLVFGNALLLKQNTYLFLQGNDNKVSKGLAGSFVGVSLIVMLAVYIVNLAYYMNLSDFMTFAIVISVFFSGLLTFLSLGCGYFKYVSGEWLSMLNKLEFREDFEAVVKSYRAWIDRFVNSFSNKKINDIKDKLFTKQLWAVGETIVGFLTAPVLAYGVSNTLAMCFPEAAGWIRIQGFRFSPVFLILASLMIAFAFFAFVSALTTIKKIQGSHVIKQDGYSDFRQHGVTIYGLEGTRKLNSDKAKMLYIGCAIVLIEFIMNVSYFISENGNDLKGLLVSFVAAFVPTAILIAETFILSVTKYEIFALEEVLAKIDKD